MYVFEVDETVVNVTVDHCGGMPFVRNEDNTITDSKGFRIELTEYFKERIVELHETNEDISFVSKSYRHYEWVLHILALLYVPNTSTSLMEYATDVEVSPFCLRQHLSTIKESEYNDTSSFRDMSFESQNAKPCAEVSVLGVKTTWCKRKENVSILKK